jgi:hypothetical protein
MEAETVSDMSEIYSILTELIAQKGFVATVNVLA